MSTDQEPGSAPQSPAITSGLELARAIECGTDEGVIVAVFPEHIKESLVQQIPFEDSKGNRTFAVLVNTGPWGERMLDVETVRGERVRWWKVKEAAAIARKDLIPIRWQGPISEIPEKYFTGYIMAVRFYKHGPWFFPGEKPKLKPSEEQKEISDSTTGA